MSTPISFFGPLTESRLHKLAAVTFRRERGLNVFWEEETRQVFYQVQSEDFRANGNVQWRSCGKPDCDGYCELSDEDEYHSILCDENGDTIYDEPIHEWWVSSDANILESVAFFKKTSSFSIFFSDLFLFKRPGHGKAADHELQLHIYDCDWSDFACEKLYLEFGVEIMGAFWDNFRRAAVAIANQDRPYSTYENLETYEAELRKVFSRKNEVCCCKEPKTEKIANTMLDAVRVGDTCQTCWFTLDAKDLARESELWKQTVRDYRGERCDTCCGTIIEEDTAGNMRCEACWEPVRLKCVCVTPTLCRSETVTDGRYASPTCGMCYRYVPDDDVLTTFEKNVREFVVATNGRL